MIDNKYREAFSFLDMCREIGAKCTYDEICKISKSQKDEYKKLLEQFKQLHGTSNSAQKTTDLHIKKGKALEELVNYLMVISGGIFSVDCNLRTTTNEIDQLVSLNELGKILLSFNLLNQKLDHFLCECKNYDNSLSVTYIGKFSSLLLTNNMKIGILFSYHGVSGKGWSNGSGLIKKFYLHKEIERDRFCIINFSIRDFEAILNGKNLLQIIDEQLTSLRLDTDYSRHRSKHPAE